MKEVQAKKRKVILGVAAVLILLLGTAAYVLLHMAGPGGCRDYTVQKEQYFVEYSEKYEYWDVITVEYPVLSGAGEWEETLNGIFYDTAMDKVNYWHLTPDDEVRKLQEEYSIYSSNVLCQVTFHSQYLMSVAFHETYAPISPVWYVHKTQRSANVNLMTGEAYELSDILRIDDDFMRLWCERAGKDYPDVILGDDDTRETLLQWFLGGDEELKDFFFFRPFFYVMEDGEFMVGISIDPNVRTVVHHRAMENSFVARLTEQELEPYRTESEFWKWYDQSQTTGEVLPCEDRKDNLWLGEESSVWDYLERQD